MKTDAMEISTFDHWIPLTQSAKPPTGESVIAWSETDDTPIVAFFDSEEGCWYAQSDGAAIDSGTISHWRFCNAPARRTMRGAL